MKMFCWSWRILEISVFKTSPSQLHRVSVAPLLIAIFTKALLCSSGMQAVCTRQEEYYISAVETDIIYNCLISYLL